MSSRSTALQHSFAVLAFLLKSVDVSCSQLRAIMRWPGLSGKVEATWFQVTGKGVDAQPVFGRRLPLFLRINAPT